MERIYGRIDGASFAYLDGRELHLFMCYVFARGDLKHPSLPVLNVVPQEYRNQHFKLIPRVCSGPWVVKKLVGSTPALIGTKVPVSYRGSIAKDYLETIIDVAKGPALGNNICNSVVGKADVVTVDLGYVIEAREDEHLPKHMHGVVRLHHLNI